MNEESKLCEEAGKAICNNRREFFVKASAVAGGLVLSLSGLKDAAAKDKSAADDTDEAVLKIDNKNPLNKVGGTSTIDTKAGKIIILHNADMSFSAYSAVCPHKGGPINYDEKTSQLFCPWHNSRFDTKGQVVKGPAKTPLQSYEAQNAIVVALKPKA